MPICWLLDTGDDSTGGIQATNYGTGPWSAYKWYDQYSNWTGVGAFGSTRAFHLNNYSTFRVDSSAADGLGATLGSGMTFSFWIKAPAAVTAWRDFMSFRVGNRYERFEWLSSNPATFYTFGTSSAGMSLATNTWQHVCMVWNEADSWFDFYLDGTKQSAHSSTTSP